MAKKHQIVISSKAGRRKAHRKWRHQYKQYAINPMTPKGSRKSRPPKKTRTRSPKRGYGTTVVYSNASSVDMRMHDLMLEAQIKLDISS